MFFTRKESHVTHCLDDL